MFIAFGIRWWEERIPTEFQVYSKNSNRNNGFKSCYKEYWGRQFLFRIFEVVCWSNDAELRFNALVTLWFTHVHHILIPKLRRKILTSMKLTYCPHPTYIVYFYSLRLDSTLYLLVERKWFSHQNGYVVCSVLCSVPHREHSFSLMAIPFVSIIRDFIAFESLQREKESGTKRARFQIKKRNIIHFYPAHTYTKKWHRTQIIWFIICFSFLNSI